MADIEGVPVRRRIVRTEPVRREPEPPGNRPVEERRAPAPEPDPGDIEEVDGVDGVDAGGDDGADSAAARKQPLLRKPWFIGLMVALVIGAIAAGLYWWFLVRPYETTDDAFIDADIVNLAPLVSGRVAEVTAVDNAHVEAGDPIVRIDATSLQAAAQSRQADLAQARAQLARTRVSVDQAKAGVGEAESNLESAQAQSRSAQDTLERNTRIADSDASAISQKSVSDSGDTARSAAAGVDAATSALASAKTAVPAAEADVHAAEAAVQAASSAVDSANIELGYATIVAPIAGRITQKSVNVGSYVAPGTAILAIVPDALYVTANFKERQLGSIHIGQTVDLAVDAYPDVEFEGTVESIQSGAGQAFQLLPPQNATGNYVKVVQRVPVRISIDGPDTADYALGPGMSVVPSVEID